MITHNTIETKLLTDDEVTTIAQLCEAVYPYNEENVETPDYWNQITFKKSINSYKNRVSYCVRLYDNELLVGFCFLLNAFEGYWSSSNKEDIKQLINYNSSQTNAGLFSYIGVLDSYKNNGYGKMLTELGMQKFKEISYEKLLLFGFMSDSELSFYTYNYSQDLYNIQMLDYNGYNLYYINL